ncbi:MAG TPA: hypothetical protein V6C88_01745 [Chroococcidiopsis sp.]
MGSLCFGYVPPHKLKALVQVDYKPDYKSNGVAKIGRLHWLQWTHY